ncbi:MAG: long-chain fatty acid--CoA ligase [Armatimonadetes bacterium]|nr:long-chain fatty acid--CoA ligase [Armatimonadota bacterium]MDW8122920.1 long-chain fatty acid--CoA ligase [Armatimonadota bacterium]
MKEQQAAWIRSYPAAVPPSLTYPEIPLSAILRDTAARFPRATATIFYGARMNYQDLYDGARSFAGLLSELGFGLGDRIGLLMPNMPSFIIAYYGTAQIGGAVVQLNPLLTARELRAELQDSGAVCLVVAEPLLDKASEAVKETSVRMILVSSLTSYVPWFIRFIVKKKTRPKGSVTIPASVKVLPLESSLRSAPQGKQVDFDPRETILSFQYTGGTTGLPKAAMLTHFNLVANLHQVSAWVYRLEDGAEVFVCVLPFFHSYGMTVGMNFAILKGATMVLLPTFDPAQTAQAIEKYRATLLPGVPPMYLAVAHHAQRQKLDISSLKVCVSGGAPLPREIHDRFVRATGAKLVEGYGLSEASPVTHVNPIWDGENRIGSIGLPLPDTDCRIVDLETGTQDLPPGQEGELLIRGPQVMKGYWNRPDETAHTLRDGWLYTGDVASMDEDGYFRIVDRKKDLVIVGGFNVYPREVEEVLYQHPKIQEVAVVGVHHAVRGEIVKAFVVLKPGESATEAEIVSFCRERLANYKVPREVEFVKELPKSAVGKILRRELRDASKR